MEEGSNVVIPVIDFSPFLNGSQEERVRVAKEIGKACEDIGFFVIKNVGVDPSIIEKAWNSSAEFFDRPLEEKMLLQKPQDEYPFGFTEIGGEVLSDGKAQETKKVTESRPDLKEMFSIGPKNPLAGFPPRQWPEHPESFAKDWENYYEAMSQLANSVLHAFAIALELPSEDYFEQFTDHHGSAMRALNYPCLDGHKPVPGQIRASAHTDYGTVTLLKSGGPGLQVSKDRDPPSWVDVPHISDVDAYVVNLGDLMRRWTNDRWQSTLHRVINPPEGSNWGRRQSIAFFYNLNPDARVSVLQIAENEEPKYPPIVAGDFLMEKHLASMKKKEI